MATDPLETAPGPVAASDNGTLRVVMERLQGMTGALVELKAIVQSIDTRMRQAELDRVSAAAVMEAKITAAHTRLDSHGEKIEANTANIKALEASQAATDKRVGTLEPAYRVMVFVGSALGLSVIALIWALITGTAKITFGA